MPQIFIEGIGNVDADGFAEEVTMQRILNVLERGDSANSPQALQRLASSANSANSSIKNAGTSAQQMSANTKQASDSARSASSAYAASAREMRQAGTQFSRSIGSSMRTLADSPLQFSRVLFEAGGELVNNLIGSAGLFGKALGGAAQGIGFAAGLLVGEMQKMNDNFVIAQKNGALLGGSLNNLRINSAAAGLTMTQFNGILAKAGTSLSAFGGQTTEGAQEFARANRLLIQTQGDQMLRMGIGFEEMGIRTAEFMETMVMSGEAFSRQGIRTRDVTQATANLARQQKVLAAFNGTTIEQEKEKARMARQDSQLQAAMLGLGARQQEAVAQLVQQFPQLSQFIKETVAFGGPVTKEAGLQASLMGTTTDAIRKTIADIESGADVDGAVSALRTLRENDAAMQQDLANLREVAILGIAGSTNEVVKIANDNFTQQLTLTRKGQAEVIDLIAEDIQRLRAPADALTTAVTNIQKDAQALQTAISSAIASGFTGENSIMATFLEAVQMPTRALRNLAESVNAFAGATTADQAGFSPGQGRAVPAGPMFGSTSNVNFSDMIVDSNTGEHSYDDEPIQATNPFGQSFDVSQNTTGSDMAAIMSASLEESKKTNSLLAQNLNVNKKMQMSIT